MTSLISRRAACTALIASAAAIPLRAAAQQGVTKDEIVIGAVGPLVGATAFIGGPARDGMQIAIGEINKRGGVNGRRLKLEFEHAFTPAENVSAVKKLVEQNKVYAVVLASGSTGAAAAADLVRASNVPTYNIFGATPIIREPFAPNVFHGAVTDVQRIAEEMMAQLVRGSTPRKIGVLAGTYAFPQSNLAVVKPLLDKSGVPYVVEQFDQNAKDFTSQLTSFRRQGVDAVLILGSFSEAGFAIKQAPTMGLPNLRWVLDGTAVNHAILPIIGSAKGVRGYYNAPYFPGQAAAPMQQFEALWKSYHGTPPQGRPNIFDIIAYGSVYVLAEAIAAAGNDLSWGGLTRAWSGLKDARPSKMGGVDVIFPESFSQGQHQGNRQLAPAEIVNGQWVTLAK
jgi:branched-chain amino acid transport system substrate-binding protein